MSASTGQGAKLAQVFPPWGPEGAGGTLRQRFPYLETPSKSKGCPLQSGGSQGHTPLPARWLLGAQLTNTELLSSLCSRSQVGRQRPQLGDHIELPPRKSVLASLGEEE